MKKVFIIASALVLSLSACQKEADNNLSLSPSEAKSFEELQVSDNFNWSTETAYSLELIGLNNMPFGIKKQLKVETLNGEVLYTTLAEISQDRSIAFKAPAGLNSVIVRYGSITKECALKNGAFHFDFIPADDTSDLDPDNL